MEPAEGPIEIKDENGQVRLSVGQDVFQGDDAPRVWTLAGAEYQTVVVNYSTPIWEEIENVGIAKVLDEVERRLRAVIEDEDFWSIEWRVRPRMEIGETRDTTARIIDKMTGTERPGTEVLNTVTVRWRWFVHKRSARPQMLQAAE